MINHLESIALSHIMNCVTCPLTVKIALKQVDGVDDADVSFNDKQAIVVFDDEKTTVKDRDCK